MAEYVNNKIFLEYLIEYQTTQCKSTYNKIGKIFLSISQNLLNKSTFINYSEDRKQEMISDAVFFMVKYINRYDTTKKNAFSYFTTIAKHAFLQYLNEHNKMTATFKYIEYIDNIDGDSETVCNDIENYCYRSNEGLDEPHE